MNNKENQEKKIKVLLVDDNPHDQDLIVDALEVEHGGFLVEIISSQDELKKLDTQKDFDILITDFNILGFTGFQVIEEIRKRTPHIPIILVTGTGSEESAIEALRRGVDDYVIKTPKHIRQLPHRILSVLKKHNLQKEHREASEAFRQLVENSPDAILVVDQENKIIFVNPRAEELFGYPKERLLNKTLYLSGLKDGKGEVDFYQKDRIWVGSVTSVEVSWFGQRATILNIRDETERILAEEALKQKTKELEIRDKISNIFLTVSDDEFYRELISAICEAVASKAGVFGIIDEDNKWILNAFYVSGVYKCKNEERTLTMSGDKWTGIWRSALVEKRIQIINEELKVPKGHIPIKRCVCIPISYGDELVGNIIVANKDTNYTDEDASLLKNIADHISPILKARMQRDAEQKKRVSVEEQFFQAQKMESIGRLAGGVAHDFNNILQLILGYGDLALKKLHPEDPVFLYVHNMIEAAKKASDLTRQLLAFSKKQTLKPRVVDLNSIILNLQNMLTRLIGEDIELVLEISPKECFVFVDPSQMEQVILNLVVNARDAMPNGGKLIIKTSEVMIDNREITPLEDIEEGQYVLLEVTDTGHGIEKDILDKIFEPFFTTKKEKGTGLGLSTVYGIVKQSEGHIYCYSEVGKGTTFKIYLPAAEKLEETTLQNKNIDIAKSKKGEILVVEDEEGLRELIKEALTEMGHRVHLAKTGLEALDIIFQKNIVPDLIITDMVMPKMGGIELIERLKEKGLHFKVIFMSGYPEKTFLEKKYNEINFLQKPFSLNELIHTVELLLN